jgi:hypothetical protein
MLHVTISQTVTILLADPGRCSFKLPRKSVVKRPVSSYAVYLAVLLVSVVDL